MAKIRKIAEGLDRTDLQILDQLQMDGRLAVAELGRRVHLSPTPCLERVRRLERDGYITGYTARLDEQRLGFDLLAFIEVSLDRTNPDFFERFKRSVADLDEVVECHMVAGNFDYLLKVRTISMADFRRFLVEKLTPISGLQQTHTYFTLESVKSRLRVPLAAEPLRRRKRR
jgi:Lrp/AsnC family leucine-responsive transcriptional regulator